MVEDYGWWGKYEMFDKKCSTLVMIWIGPLFRKEMESKYFEFRHNFSKNAPIERKIRVLNLDATITSRSSVVKHKKKIQASGLVRRVS